MPIISFIPDGYKDGFKELASLEKDTFTAIQEALLSLPLKSSTEELASDVAQIKGLEKEKIKNIFSSIEGLISFLDEENEIDEISNDVVSILFSNGLITKEDGPHLKNRILSLLNDKKIYYAYKAEDLISENKNFFIQCRIVTDIRPIFDLDVEQAPKAGFITHTLHIHYSADGGAPHKDFYITLEPGDIGTLIEALLRAERKEKGLQSIFKNSGMTNLNE